MLFAESVRIIDQIQHQLTWKQWIICAELTARYTSVPVCSGTCGRPLLMSHAGLNPRVYETLFESGVRPVIDWARNTLFGTLECVPGSLLRAWCDAAGHKTQNVGEFTPRAWFSTFSKYTWSDAAGSKAASGASGCKTSHTIALYTFWGIPGPMQQAQRQQLGHRVVERPTHERSRPCPLWRAQGVRSLQTGPCKPQPCLRAHLQRRVTEVVMMWDSQCNLQAELQAVYHSVVQLCCSIETRSN